MLHYDTNQITIRSKAVNQLSWFSTEADNLLGKFNLNMCKFNLKHIANHGLAVQFEIMLQWWILSFTVTEKQLQIDDLILVPDSKNRCWKTRPIESVEDVEKPDPSNLFHFSFQMQFDLKIKIFKFEGNQFRSTARISFLILFFSGSLQVVLYFYKCREDFHPSKDFELSLCLLFHFHSCWWRCLERLLSWIRYLRHYQW